MDPCRLTHALTPNCIFPVPLLPDTFTSRTRNGIVCPLAGDRLFSSGQGNSLQLFSTCPQSKEGAPADYIPSVIEVARWSESLGYAGILVYTDNGLVDPWLVAQVILRSTKRIAPLVAVQPIYMHPYAAATMVASMGYFYGRRVFLNMLAGGFRNDLTALGDHTPHDERYDRTTEYALVIRGLLENPDGLTFEGKYYQVKNLKMSPALPEELQPGMLISGSSEAGMKAAEAIGAVGVRYPQPAGEEVALRETNVDCGVRVGIIARPQAAEAWKVGKERFPEDRRGELAHELAMKVSDSSWHTQLSETGNTLAPHRNPYWLHPFKTYKTFCPYLVGDYDNVAGEVARYIALGYRTFILDIPTSYEELEHASIVFAKATRLAH